MAYSLPQQHFDADSVMTVFRDGNPIGFFFFYKKNIYIYIHDNINKFSISERFDENLTRLGTVVNDEDRKSVL